MEISAAEAARNLAELLGREGASLDSDDISTVSASMTAVRAAARDLESALVSRGWGGDVLYGFGNDHGEDDLDDLDGDNWDDLDDLFADDEEVPPQPVGVRMTFQSRHDFVVTDEPALAAYVTARLTTEGETPWTAEAVADALECEGPLAILANLDGFGMHDYSQAGLVYAGGQDAWREVSRTLWEMGETEDFDVQGDQFPTSG